MNFVTGKKSETIRLVKIIFVRKVTSDQFCVRSGILFEENICFLPLDTNASIFKALHTRFTSQNNKNDVLTKH